MIFSLILISACFLSQVSSHGRVFTPIPRHFVVHNYHKNEVGCYVSWQLHYLKGFKCNNVCGNSGDSETGEIDPRYEKTGPIQAVYKMGQTIEVKFDATGHRGYFRFRLCKLSNPTDMVNQECLDENLLELSNLKVDSYDTRLRDKYTIEKSNPYVNATVQVKLPDGLTCDNCVLQWEWITTISRDCFYRDGKLAPTEYCLNQVYKNCIDIKIEQDSTQSNQVYKPNPVESVYPKTDPKSHPTVFTMMAWPHMKMDANGKVMKPEKPDELAYKGSGLVCFAYGDYIINEYWHNVAFETLCRENCMSPDKKCPDECHCRWFNWL